MEKEKILADKENPLEIEYSQEVITSRSPHTLGLIEHFHNNEDVDFHISSQREMLSILQSIADQGTRICLYYGNDQDFILTTLLDVNEHGMWLDIGPFSPENKQLLLSDKITFISQYQHAKIQFVVRDIVSDLFENNEAFYMKLPSYLLRIQRREFFRAAIPPTDLVKCIIPVQPENPDDPVIMREASLVDISGGGIRLLCEGNEATLLPNKTFPNCQILLPDVGTLTVTIEVRSNINFVTPNNEFHKRVGCRFIHLDNQINIPLQRHITRLQSKNMQGGRLAAL